MLRIVIGAIGLLLAGPAWAASEDLCSANSSVSDVQFVLAVKGGQTAFQEGEIIPLNLSFTSTTKNRYWADIRNYDRSGRLGIEAYCVAPAVPDPLASYFKACGFISGGLGSTQALGAKPVISEAELNEWRSLQPGRYKVFAISYRVWRLPDRLEQTPYERVQETVRSNTVDLDIRAASTQWQDEQIRRATEILARPASPNSPSWDDAKRAARILRFLNTEASAKVLSKLFWSLNAQQPNGWELMFGLFASPYRKLAIDSMRSELAAPDHPITNEFLNTLVELQITADPAWDAPTFDPARPEMVLAFWDQRRAHVLELTTWERQKVIAVLPRKTSRASAVTLSGLAIAGTEDPALAHKIHPQLVAAWQDLPEEMRNDLVANHWPAIAGPDMLPVLRQMISGPPPPPRTTQARTRDAALRHIYDLDPVEGQASILHDLLNADAQPGMDVIRLLPQESIALAVQPALERIRNRNARELDYDLLDRYADVRDFEFIQTAFEGLDRMACVPQTAMLRYFLRVAPEYGAKQVSGAMRARKDTHCYTSLLQSLGDELPPAQQSAIDALNDPDLGVVQDATITLRQWGSGDAEPALWSRLQIFHQDWAGKADQLRFDPASRTPGSRGAALEQDLVGAIAQGNNWLCPPDQLARLHELVWTSVEQKFIDNWIKEWKRTPALIIPDWYREGRPTFSVLQYSSLTEAQLRTKLAHLPPGMRMQWQFWKQGPPGLSKQEALYESMRAVAAQNGIVLEKASP